MGAKAERLFFRAAAAAGTREGAKTALGPALAAGVGVSR